MKKLSLRTRLMVLNALLLIASCLILYISLSNSAVLRLDEIENCVVELNSVEAESVSVTIDLSEFLPNISDTIREARADFRTQSIVITLLIILIGGGLTWVLAGLSLRPLRDFADRIGEITEQNLSCPVPMPESRDEVAGLAVSFNQMLARLDAAFTAQKQFVANAAHELRTPLTVIQTKLEVFCRKQHHTEEEYQTAISSTLSQTERLSKLVSTLLELLSMHSVETGNTIELEPLIEEVICDLGNIADRKQIKLIQHSGNAVVKGNDELIYRAVYNLVENAIKYNHEGGSVEVTISEKDSAICIEVTDSGQGIEKEKWEEIFDPFYRVDKSRSRAMGGAGLGLALVKSIAELHGGKAYVACSSVGGSTVIVELHKWP